MTNILQYNRTLLEQITEEVAFYAPIHEQTEDAAICSLQNLHYNEKNGRIVHPPVDDVVSCVDIEVRYERAGNSRSGFWLPQMEFAVKRPKTNNDSWDNLPFGTLEGDFILRDSLQQFLFFEVNKVNEEFRG